jgi:hypothetical protein
MDVAETAFGMAVTAYSHDAKMQRSKNAKDNTDV